MKRMRFHILGMPHTKTVDWWGTCAYTQKILKLCSMLHKLGHEVFHYGTEGSEVECTKHFNVMSSIKHKKIFGDDWKNNHTFDIADDYHSEWYTNAAKAIDNHLQRKDFILCMWGMGHTGVLDRIPNVQDRASIVEPGIGYGIESQIDRKRYNTYRIFESYTWYSYCLGREEPLTMGCFTKVPTYDVVIPNYWNPNDFIFEAEKDDYFLFFGRCSEEKGTIVAAEVCKAAGVKLVMAGQNQKGAEPFKHYDNIEFIGFVDNEKRAQLMSKAKAVFTASQFHEPFGGVAVEAQMCGTPVISSDWGVFNETVLHGITGYRCRTLDQFIYAVNNVDKLDTHQIRTWAATNFSMDRVAPMYHEYFSMIDSLWNDKGWYDIREDLNGEWLKKEYPQNIKYVTTEQMVEISKEKTKTQHFISTGKDFPYFYYLSVMSALKTHKGPITLWTTEDYDNEYYQLLKDKINIINIKEHLVYKPLYEQVINSPLLEGASDNDIAVALCDVLSIAMKSNVGGCWAGLGSLFLKDKTDLISSEKELTIGACPSHWQEDFYSPLGGMWRPNSLIASTIFNKALKRLELPSTEYKWGCLGIDLFNEVINENKDKVSILPHGTLTAHHDSVDTLFHTTLNLFPDARIIVPYTTAYNKVHKKPLSKIITPEWIWNTNSHYTNIIKQFLTEEEINGKI